MTMRQKSGKHEKRAAKKLGVRLTPNSGAGHIRGDMQDSCYLIEHKFTNKEQFILKREMLDKTREQAIQCGKKAKWIVSIAGKDYTILEGII